MKDATGGKERGLWSRISIALLAGSLLILLATFIVPAFASAEGSPPDARRLEQVISDHFSGSDFDLSAPDVEAYVSSYGVPGAPTYGPEAVFNPGGTEYVSAAALSESKFVVAYRDTGDPYSSGISIIGEASGKNVTYSPETVFNSSYPGWTFASAPPDSKFVIAYSRWDGGSNNPRAAIIGDMSGNVITYGQERVFNQGTTFFTSAVAIMGCRFAVAYDDSAAMGYGTAIVGGIDAPSVQTNAASGLTTSEAALNGRCRQRQCPIETIQISPRVVSRIEAVRG